MLLFINACGYVDNSLFKRDFINLGYLQSGIVLC